MTKQSEHKLQKEIVKLLKYKGIDTIGCDVMSGLMFTGKDLKKRISFIEHHKAIGATVGQPDIVLLLDDGEVLLVEVKNGDKGILSPEQKRFREKCLKKGHTYVVWRKIEDAIEFTRGLKGIYGRH